MPPGIWVAVKTAAELNALETPPPSPFSVDVTLTLINDEGDTRTGTIRITTTYDRVEPGVPTFTRTAKINLPPGTHMEFDAAGSFANAGTNPILRTRTHLFSDNAKDYYLIWSMRRGGILQVRVRSNAQLNALSPPPPNPFTVTANVVLHNDEFQIVPATFTFETTWTPASSSGQGQGGN